MFNLDAKHGPLEIGDYDKNGKWRRQWKLDSNGKSSEKTLEGWEGYFGKDGIFGKNGKYGEHPPKSQQKFKWNGKGAFWKKGAILTKKKWKWLIWRKFVKALTTCEIGWHRGPLKSGDFGENGKNGERGENFPNSPN